MIGIDAWDEFSAGIAVQFNENGWMPKVVLMNETTYEEHFEDVTDSDD